MSPRPRGRRRRSPAGSPVNRTAELARNRERRSHRLRRLLFVGLIGALALGAIYQFWLRESSLFEIKNLEIVGVTAKGEEGKQIKQAVRTAMGEMTTLAVKPDLLTAELARFPRVAATEISPAFPDSATVTVQLREDGSIYGEGSAALLVAIDGTVLGPAAGREGSLPTIGYGGQAGSPGEDEADPDGGGRPEAGDTLTGRALAQAIVLGAVPPELRSFLAGSSSGSDGILVYFDDGPTLRFGNNSQLDEKWRATAALIAAPDFDLGSYVDLTVPRRPAVSPEPPDEATAESEGSAPPEELPSG